MEELPGQRPGTRRFHNPHDEYDYHMHGYYQRRYICVSRTSRWQCPVEVMWLLDNTIRYVSNIQEHNHPQPIHHRERRQLILALKEQAIELSQLSSREVLDIVYNQFRNLAFLLTLEAGLMHINRSRAKYQPAVPELMADLGDMLEQYMPANAVYQGHVAAEDGSFATIFAADAMIDRLNDCRELHVSITFKSVPNRPRAVQLVTLFLRQSDIGIPAVFILCERRTTALYCAVWDFLLDQAPEMSAHLRTFYGDYETELITSIRIAMPRVAFRGCWINFVKAVTHKWMALGLCVPQCPQNVLHFSWALPLLPENLFEAAVNIIQGLSRPAEQQYENIILFVAQLRNKILPIADIISVYDDQVRVYNIPEAFNRQIVRLLGGREPSLTCFIQRLSKVIQGFETELRENRLDVKKTRRAYQVNDEKHIRVEQATLRNNRLLLHEFLGRVIKFRLRQDISHVVYDLIKIPRDIPDEGRANFPRRGAGRRQNENQENVAGPADAFHAREPGVGNERARQNPDDHHHAPREENGAREPPHYEHNERGQQNGDNPPAEPPRQQAGNINRPRVVPRVPLQELDDNANLMPRVQLRNRQRENDREEPFEVQEQYDVERNRRRNDANQWLQRHMDHHGHVGVPEAVPVTLRNAGNHLHEPHVLQHENGDHDEDVGADPDWQIGECNHLRRIRPGIADIIFRNITRTEYVSERNEQRPVTTQPTTVAEPAGFIVTEAQVVANAARVNQPLLDGNDDDDIGPDPHWQIGECNHLHRIRPAIVDIIFRTVAHAEDVSQGNGQRPVTTRQNSETEPAEFMVAEAQIVDNAATANQESLEPGNPAQEMGDALNAREVDRGRDIPINEDEVFDDVLAEDTEPPKCHLCEFNVAKIAFIPCGHLAACLRCSAGMDIIERSNREDNPNYKSVCPLCREEFQSKIRPK